MFDLAPLSASHFVFLLLSFMLSYGAIAFWRLKYAGIILGGMVTALSGLVIPDVSLRLGLIIATLIIIAVGRADETKPLSAAAQLGWQVVISLMLVLSGWTIPYVTNPLGPGVIVFGIWSIPFTAFWIILLMNAVNWLDGLDGLASSVAVVAFLTLAAVSLLPATQDATTLSLSLIGAGSLLAFFLHNAPPAKAYLGTTGSWFVGAFLALTALIGGGKVATSALVLSLPLLDVFFVVAARLLAKQKPWRGDKKHLHYRLAALGWPPRQIVTAAVIFTAALGIIAVTAQTLHKLWALAAVALFLAATILVLSRYTYDQQKNSHR